MRVVDLWRVLAAATLLAILYSIGAVPASAADAAASPIRVIIELPNDENARALVGRFTSASMQAPPPIAAQPESAIPSISVASDLQDLRNRLLLLGDAAPALPAQLRNAMRIFQSSDTIDPIGLLLAVILFVAGGFIVQRIAWWSARSLVTFVMSAPVETIRQRLKLHACRLAMGVLALAGYLIGSLGAFILFPWPQVFRDIALILLSAALMVRLAVLVGRVVLAPGASLPHMRLLTIATSLARFWYWWLVGIVTALAAAWATAAIFRAIHAPPILVDLILAAWLGVVAAALVVMIWLRQFRTDGPQLNRLIGVWLTVATLVSWFLWVSGLHAALWTLVIIVMLPFAVSVVHDIIRRITLFEDEAASSDATVVGWSVVIMQTLRNALIVCAAPLVANAWHVNLSDLAAGETMLTRAARAGMRVVIVLLVTDVIWKLVRAMIDTEMAISARAAIQATHEDGPEMRRRQRLNTLLPILRNVLFVAIGAVGLLMILDAVGIQIGPLLAGAGVIGIAVGFGAQTLVKDIISGVFYLFDDAFRIGEYIQSSKYQGTVEGFSLRSIRLRHHRGPITIVPFGELGAVQNLSRDWVIDKFSLTLSYGNDLEQVRKTVKRVGLELAADPELGAGILEPLKMQGIEQLGDYGIEVRLKFMAKPGEQAMIRRKALAMLARTFAEEGILFATPTVHVAGGAEAAPAAAARQVQARAEAQKAQAAEASQE
jgi:small-conductance mechanosensitive channel